MNLKVSNGTNTHTMTGLAKHIFLVGMLFATGIALPTKAAEPVVFTFKIAPQSISQVLADYTGITGIAIGFGDVDLTGKPSRGLNGRYEAHSALKLLLKATGFSFEEISPKLYRILPDSNAAIAVQARAPMPPPVVGKRPSLNIPFRENDIIVTASKRKTTLFTLPASVSVLTSDTINAFGIENGRDAIRHFAGVTMTNLGAGRNKIFIRGLSDGTFVDRTQSTVGIYLDDTPITFSDTNPDLRFIDVERVEILRGPQGTLYGAGSIGGTYRVVSKKPDFDGITAVMRATGSTTKSGTPNGSIEAIVNLPLIDNILALRLGGYREHTGGFIDDIGLGETNINQDDVYGGKAALRWQLAENWTVDLVANFQKISIEDTQYTNASLGRFTRNNFLSEPYTDIFRHTNLTFEGSTGWADIVSATSYINRDIRSRSDATRIVPLLTGLGLVPSPYHATQSIQTLVHETRLSSVGEHSIDWLAGVFFLARDEVLNTSITTPGAGQIFAAQGFPGDRIFIEKRDDKTRQLALFGEAIWNVTPRLSLTGGLRWFQTSLNVTSRTDGFSNQGLKQTTGKNRKGGIAPKLVISFRANDDLLVYTQVAEGFRVGGININTPAAGAPVPDPEDLDADITAFGSDKVRNYEMGIKSSFFDQHVNFNGSAFITRWNNIQTDQLLPSGFAFVTNAGRARNIGFEAEVRVRLFSNLELSANGVWNVPELLKDNTFLGAKRGDRLPGIAEFSAGAGALWRYRLPNAFMGSLALDYTYIGSSALTFAEDAAPQMGGYSTTNVRLEVQKERWSVGLFADNVTNNKGNTFAFGNPFSLGDFKQSTPQRPRTIGVFLKIKK